MIDIDDIWDDEEDNENVRSMMRRPLIADDPLGKFSDYISKDDLLAAKDARIAELEAQNEFIMSANNELSWALKERDEALSRIAELEAENERFLNMLTKFANANSDICEVVKNGGSDSEAMRIFFVHLTDMMDDIMKLRAELGKE